MCCLIDYSIDNIVLINKWLVFGSIASRVCYSGVYYRSHSFLCQSLLNTTILNDNVHNAAAVYQKYTSYLVNFLHIIAIIL